MSASRAPSKDRRDMLWRIMQAAKLESAPCSADVMLDVQRIVALYQKSNNLRRCQEPPPDR